MPNRTVAGRSGPCWDSNLYSTMPRFGGVVMDPRRIESPPAQREYLDQWRSWAAGRLPHQLPSYINEILAEEARLLRGSKGNASTDWD